MMDTWSQHLPREDPLAVQLLHFEHQALEFINLFMWPLRGFDDFVDFAMATALALLVILITVGPPARCLTCQAKLALVAMGIGLGFRSGPAVTG